MMQEKVEYAIETRDLCKSFGDLKANDHISLKIRKNTIHAIAGENGAGKSTLMNMLTDILTPDSGEILVNGEPVVFKNPMDAVKKGIGMIYQEFMLAADMSVLDNIITGFEVRKGMFIDQKESRRKVEKICKDYNLSIPLDEPIRDLPVAIQQQVEIVKVLYRGADIIIMDEPTAVLTPQGIEGLFAAMRMLKGLGKTILFISHKLNEVFEICDEITVLRDGKQVGTYLPENMTPQLLANYMVGREVMLQAKKRPAHFGDVLLSVKNLRVNDKDGVERVHGVNLELHAGEILGIAGVAGSGENFLIEALFGLTKPAAGSKIVFNGVNMTRELPFGHRKAGIGYVPQDRMGTGCNRPAPIWENAIMGYHKAHGFKSKWLVDKKQSLAFTKAIKDNFDVKYQSPYDKIGSLSGGNVQKLIVGREMLQKNALLIAEDPTRGIDVGAIEYIWEKIIDFADQGGAVLLVSHELNEVMQLSDTIRVIFNGQLYDAGHYKELSEAEIGLIMTGGVESA